MATVLNPSTNQVKLSNGSVVTAQVGGFYDGQQYWGGTLSEKGKLNTLSNQPGAGQSISQEVKNASAVAQGVTPTNFNAYLKDLSITNIQPTTSVPLTNNIPGNSAITGLTAEAEKARTTLDQTLATQRADTQAKLATAKASESAAVAKIGELSTPFRETLQTTRNAELGVDTVLSEQRSLLGELDTLLTEGNALIKQQQEVTGLSAIRNPRIQKTMDDVAARAGVINAVVSLQNTYLANAYTSIDRSVNAITQDRQDQLNYYGTILNLANRDIVSLTAEDRATAEKQVALLTNDLDRANTTVDYIKQLMVNPDKAMAMAQSGVSLNDSIEVINQKMSNYAYSKEVREAANALTSAGGVLVSSPAGIPANRLKSFTDSKGVTYYYKMPATGTATTTTADSYLKTIVSQNNTSSSSSTTKSTPQEQPPAMSANPGTIYTNPTTGSIWQSTNSGWKKII